MGSEVEGPFSSLICQHCRKGRLTSKSTDDTIKELVDIVTSFHKGAALGFVRDIYALFAKALPSAWLKCRECGGYHWACGHCAVVTARSAKPEIGSIETCPACSKKIKIV